MSKSLLKKIFSRSVKDRGSNETPSSETQGQIVGTSESLNGRENVARRKVKNGEKSPWGQCLTRPVPNGHSRSGCWLVPENFCVFLPNQKPEWRRPFVTGLVRHCPQGSSLYFSSYHIFAPVYTFPRPHYLRLRGWLKHHLLCACYLGFDWSDWIVLIKSGILIMTGIVWPVSSDKWKAPLDKHIILIQLTVVLCLFLHAGIV